MSGVPKPTAKLNNWRHFGEILFGRVEGHPHLEDGSFISTSRVLKMDEAAGIAETRNTIYQLGQHAEEIQIRG